MYQAFLTCLADGKMSFARRVIAHLVSCSGVSG
jgi:hypothetical protein